jgi:hypothetical protein
MIESRKMTRPERARFLRLQLEDLLGEAASGGWSRPYTVSELARRFGCGRTAMRKLLVGGAVASKPCGARWRIAMYDLPAGPP